MSTAKLLKLTSTIVKSNFTRLAKPYKLNFSITYNCQSRCIHCNIWQIHPKNELTLDEIKNFAKENNYFKWIELTGGEPFLRSDIVEIVRTFKENCNDLFLLTIPVNSLCNYDIYMRKLEEIAQMGIPNIVVTVSLDGYRELHERIRGVPGNYDRAVKVFKGIKELGKKYKNLMCVFGFTIIKPNSGQFEKFVEEVRKEVPDVSYSDFHINIGQLSDNYYGNSNSATTNEIAAEPMVAMKDIQYLLTNMKKVRETNLVRSAKTYLEVKYMEGLVEFLQSGKSAVPNRDGELSVFLDSYGNLYPSIMTTRKIWNIREQGYNLINAYKEFAAGNQKETYFTACESYQSILGAILKR